MKKELGMLGIQQEKFALMVFINTKQGVHEHFREISVSQ